ncbi:M20/M25/M40 family metallo-hydrolase [Parasphingopyxis marina]|uniref:Carboxypeptidase Q n=1 Tax=Parasphingopyxis marina TaxID=2761622 RepID=A0A842HZK6_9SPHN|nr:M20/M25/M40 family metallo-hydrolase [Parasphingopyxis marina]MBC2777801.1 M20/M25/M40 family metallo-hydrolase [Parasphingopyxis marina]
MRKLVLGAAALAITLPASLPAQRSIRNQNISLGSTLTEADAAIASMRDEALSSDTIAWDITEGLTTEIGQRLAGTPAEARARAWAVQHLNDLGFANVRIEPFTMNTWVRGEERARVVGDFEQDLVIAALGSSGATPEEGITAEVIGFASVADLRAAPLGSLAGKIAYVTHHMERTQDGSGYGFAGPARWIGPSLAAERGAVGIVIRSVGTDSHRNPHTGGTSWAEGVTPIPAGALSNPDADNLERMLARGTVRLHLTLTPRWIGQQPSGNVIAEVPGRDPEAGIVLIACHLDSWDLATGAFDDAAGCGIVAAAAHRFLERGQRPRRTIRLLWAGAEEVGVFGGDAYFARHGGDNHVLAAESDFGADRVWRVDFRLPPAAETESGRLAALLAPLGIARGRGRATGGADTGSIVRAGTPAIDLRQDGTRYFDLHHTPDDTLDKIDPAQLRQNVAAWATMLAVMADSSADWGAFGNEE